MFKYKTKYLKINIFQLLSFFTFIQNVLCNMYFIIIYYIFLCLLPLKPKIEVDKTVILNLGVVTFLGVANKLFGIANEKMLFVYI